MEREYDQHQFDQSADDEVTVDFDYTGHVPSTDTMVVTGAGKSTLEITPTTTPPLTASDEALATGKVLSWSLEDGVENQDYLLRSIGRSSSGVMKVLEAIVQVVR